METSRLRGIAALAVATVTLAACAVTAPARTSFGPLTTGSTAAPPAPGGQPSNPPTHPPTSSPHPGGGGAGSIAPSSAPPASGGPASGGATSTFLPGPPRFTQDYAIRATTSCYWRAGGSPLQIGAQWTISFSNKVAPQPLTATLTNDLTSDQSTLTYTTQDLETIASLGGQMQMFLGSQLAQSSPFPGHTVTLTLTITPQGADLSSTNNVADVVVDVPSDTSGAKYDSSSIPCHT